MARTWSVPFDPLKHRDQMPEVTSRTSDHWRAPTLLRGRVYFVSVCSFTFQFHSVEQIAACLAYYDRKLHPSSRLCLSGGGDHWEFQRWFERLPLYLREESKRLKVVKALNDALERYQGRPGRSTGIAKWRPHTKRVRGRTSDFLA